MVTKKKELAEFNGMRSRLTIGQIKEIISSSKDEYTRQQFTEILWRMGCWKKGWVYLMYNYNEELGCE